ncbi:MAG: hypothetical protein DHS20C15_24660 [Planctomycetota bacterium]|nr:MAG: hypothetical protein DHS20C15_24660 [Planctomycetota bacterium]
MLRSILSVVAVSLVLLTPVTAQADGTPPGDNIQAQQQDAQRTDLNVKNVPLSDVIDALSAIFEVSIVAGVETSRPVSVNLYQSTLEEALDWVLRPLALGWYFDGKVYTILEATEIDLIQRPLLEQIFRPNYRSAAELQGYIVKFLSPYGSVIVSEPPTVGIGSGEDDAGGIESTLQEMIIVIDNEDSLARIERLVREFDTRPRQVLVEATILEVTLDETNRFGVDFNFLGASNFRDNNYDELTDFQDVYYDPAVAAGGTGGAGAAAANVANTGGIKSFNQSGFTDGPGSDGLRLGFIGKDIAFFVEALQSTADTNVLANTKVLALNKMRGEIIIGGRLGYFGGTTVSDGISQQTVEFLEVGTQLRFRPFIGDDGFVRLEIHPERSSGIVDPNTGLPTEQTTEVTTNVMVRDDETVVIGGLIETREVQTVRRVPFLGYLPWVGWLFSSEETTVERSEIVVMLTPRILEDGEVYEDGQLILDEHRQNASDFIDGFGPVARRTYALRTLDESREAFDDGRLQEARSLCDRVIALDPLAEGLGEYSREIDRRLADARMLEMQARNGGN